jgi:hypothetical protein
MGYRQNNPNFQQAPAGGLFEQLLPFLLSGGGGGGAQQGGFESNRPDTGRLTSRDPGMGNDTPYVIGSGPGGEMTDFGRFGAQGGLTPYQPGPWDELYGLGSGVRRGAGVAGMFGVPPWLANLLGRGMQAGAGLGGYDPNAPQEPIFGPPAPERVPRSVINDGWENLFLGDSEYFWNSIQPNVRRGAGGGGSRGEGSTGVFRGSGGWGLPYF